MSRPLPNAVSSLLLSTRHSEEKAADSPNTAVQDTHIKATVSSTMGAFSLLDHADEIRSAVLVVHGEKAYSLPVSQEALGKLKGDNKELIIIPDASHTDLYDRMDIIPFDKIEAFFRKYLK